MRMEKQPFTAGSQLDLPVRLWVADARNWPCCSAVPMKAPGTPTLREAALGL